jgi:signal peptidase II
LAFWVAFLGSATADYLTKSWVRNNIPLGETRTIIDGLLTFVHWSNSGAAFGFLRNASLYLAIVSGACVVAAVVMYPKLRSLGLAFAISLGLVSGGALGNFLDRIRFGSVTDFVSLSFFAPIFNVADSAIVVGAFMMIGLLMFSMKESL